MIHQAFAETAAQVIPILFLAVAVESRLFENGDSRDSERTFFLLLFAASTFVAESFLLVGLYERKDLSNLQITVVYVSITWGLLLVAGLPFFSQWRALKGHYPRAGIAGQLAFLVVLVALFLSMFHIARASVFPNTVAGVVLVALLILGVFPFRRARTQAMDTPLQTTDEKQDD